MTQNQEPRKQLRGKVLAGYVFPFGQRAKFLEASSGGDLWEGSGVGLMAGLRVLGVGVVRAQLASLKRPRFWSEAWVSHLLPASGPKQWCWEPLLRERHPCLLPSPAPPAAASLTPLTPLHSRSLLPPAPAAGLAGHFLCWPRHGLIFIF